MVCKVKVPFSVATWVDESTETVRTMEII
jgi:hypothetical protein